MNFHTSELWAAWVGGPCTKQDPVGLTTITFEIVMVGLFRTSIEQYRTSYWTRYRSSDQNTGELVCIRDFNGFYLTLHDFTWFLLYFTFQLCKACKKNQDCNKQSVCIMDNGMSQGFWILLTLLTFHLPISTEIHIQPVATCESRGDLVPRRWHCWWDACTTWRSQVRPNGWKLKGFDSETYLAVISRIRMVGWMKWCEMVDGTISYNLCIPHSNSSRKSGGLTLV